MAYLSLKNVTKEYHSGEVTIKALSGVNLEIEEGELCVIVGPSGAGKTTLLNILGGMDCCTGGEVVLDGEHIENMTAKRSQHTGGTRLALFSSSIIWYRILPRLKTLNWRAKSARIPCRPRMCLFRLALAKGFQTFLRSFPAASSSAWR